MLTFDDKPPMVEFTTKPSIRSFFQQWKAIVESGQPPNEARAINDSENEATTIVIPDGLTEDEIVALVREKITEMGGDPDTAYMVQGGILGMPRTQGETATITYTVNYEAPKS